MQDDAHEFAQHRRCRRVAAQLRVGEGAARDLELVLLGRHRTLGDRLGLRGLIPSKRLTMQQQIDDWISSIQDFISRHSPLPRDIALQDAPFWSDSQSHFLEEGLEEDSDWAEIIDELDARMRA